MLGVGGKTLVPIALESHGPCFMGTGDTVGGRPVEPSEKPAPMVYTGLDRWRRWRLI